MYRNLTPAQIAEVRALDNKGSMRVRLKGCNGVVYVRYVAGRVHVKGYQGRAARPAFHYSFSSMEKAARHVAEFQRGLIASAAAKAERSAKKKAFVHNLVVGDVLRSIWGYDQTNVDFYQVTQVVGALVEIRQIAAVSEPDGALSGYSAPAVGQFMGEPMRRRVLEGNKVKVRDFAWAWPLEFQEIAGAKVYRPERWTAYA